jgi:hypothetical protein
VYKIAVLKAQLPKVANIERRKRRKKSAFLMWLILKKFLSKIRKNIPRMMLEKNNLPQAISNGEKLFQDIFLTKYHSKEYDKADKIRINSQKYFL